MSDILGGEKWAPKPRPIPRLRWGYGNTVCCNLKQKSLNTSHCLDHVNIFNSIILCYKDKMK